jgi:hypothetical protein
MRQDRPGTYALSVFDDEIDPALQQRVNDFLLDSEYCVNFHDHSHSLWYPRTDTWVTPRTHPSQPRLPLAWDRQSLEHRAPAVHDLWLAIDSVLGNRYVIEGVPEGMSRYMTGISPLSDLAGHDGSPGKPNCSWRVYGSGNERELRTHTKSIHRDSPFVDRDDYFNVVYFANAEWHPQFYGETLFHSDVSTTGDYTGRFDQDQRRNFPIGEVENTVAIKPGRFMLYDARYLHQLKPAAHYAPNILGLVFRLQQKTQPARA